MCKTILFFLLVLAVLATAFLYLKKEKKEKTVILGFGGDTMLGRLTNKTIDKKGYAYPWGNIIPLLKSTDINIVNLETTLTNKTKKVPKVFNFKATPDKVKTLQMGNIHVVNLANNHVLDFYDSGLIETIETLDKAKIKHVGAGATIQQARKPVILTANGIKIGIIGYTDYPADWAATENKPGTNVIKIGDIQKIKQDIKEVRPHVDILIATIHWGPNMRQHPPKEFQDFAHQMIDAGIDIIHGHSAHIFQGIEVYNNKLIMYDTGDFVDDYIVDPVLRNDRSFFYKVCVDTSGIKKVKLIPLLISNMQVNMAEGENIKEAEKKIKKLSAQFSTKIDNLIIKIN